jgi:hypothetical protein
MSALPLLALLRRKADVPPSTYQSLEKGTLPSLCTRNQAEVLKEVKGPEFARQAVTVHQSQCKQAYWHLPAAQWQATIAETYLEMKQ